MPNNLIPTSVPWYPSEAVYLEAAALAGSKNPMPYASWVAQIETLEREITSRGHLPVRVEIETAAVKAWCDVNRVSFSREAIAKYATLKMLDRLDKPN